MKRLTTTNLVTLFLLHAVILPLAAIGQVADVGGQIRKEGLENSKIMRTMHFLTDVHGPRLTGSPNHKAAAEWAAKEMTSWGLANAHSSRGILEAQAGSMTERRDSLHHRCKTRLCSKCWRGLREPRKLLPLRPFISFCRNDRLKKS